MMDVTKTISELKELADEIQKMPNATQIDKNLSSLCGILIRVIEQQNDRIAALERFNHSPEA